MTRRVSPAITFAAVVAVTLVAALAGSVCSAQAIGVHNIYAGPIQGSPGMRISARRPVPTDCPN